MRTGVSVKGQGYWLRVRGKGRAENRASGSTTVDVC